MAYGGLPLCAYALDEVNGTTAIDLMTRARGSSNNGTYGSGASVANLLGPFRSGQRSVKFDNTNNGVVTIPAGVSLSTGSAITIEFWNYVTASELTGSHSSFTIGNAAGGTTTMCQSHAPLSSGNRTIFWDYGTNVAGRVSTSYASYLDKWTHVALVSSGSGNTFKGIYLDGVLVNSAASSVGPTAAISGGYIGAWVVQSLRCANRMAGFRVYSYMLDANRIRYHALAERLGVMGMAA